MKHGYFAPAGFEEALAHELPQAERYGRLFLAPPPSERPLWVQNIWFEPRIISFSSVSDAAKKLRELGSLWAFYPERLVRKGALIEKKLPYFAPKLLVFPCKLPTAPLGSWMLLDEKTLIAAPNCSSPFPHGEPQFLSTPIPPSRAYLKLWEVFTLLGDRPKQGDICLEIGASPGSWTWALQQLGASVTAVDRAPLSPEISALPGVSFLKKDAFTFEPDNKIEWLFSDAACTPEKLLRWLEKWLQGGSKANIVCTLKFQGENNYAIAREFEKIEGSNIFHLFHNKHELTWVRHYTRMHESGKISRNHSSA